MTNQTTPIVFTALGAALLLAAPSYAQNLDKPPSAPPPPPAAQKSLSKAPTTTSGKFTLTEMPGSGSAAKDVPEPPRTDNKFIK
jgi:hypothetical protein